MPPSEQEVLETNSHVSREAKEKFLERRGVEILHFIDAFIQCAGIPEINYLNNRCIGGLALAGWSLGSAFTLAAIANVNSNLVSHELQNRLEHYLRAHIMLGKLSLLIF